MLSIEPKEGLAQARAGSADSTGEKGKEGRRPSLPVVAAPCDGVEPNTSPCAAPTGRRRRAVKERDPKMGLHRATGQARVKLSGVEHYCGVYGTAAAAARYAELVNQWRAAGKRPPRDEAVTVVQAVVTVRSLFDLFLAHVDATGRYSKAGAPTGHRLTFEWIRESLTTALGNPPVARLSEASMIAWRDVLERNRKRTRQGINRMVAGALQVLRWGRARRHVPKAVFADCAAIEPLKRGEVGDRPEHGRPRRAVSAEEAEKVATACKSRQVAAMVRLQALCGMRPGEVCGMRWADIDKASIPVRSRTRRSTARTGATGPACRCSTARTSSTCTARGRSRSCALARRRRTPKAPTRR